MIAQRPVVREPLDPQLALFQVLFAGLIGVAAGAGRVRLRADEVMPPLVTIWTAAMAAMLGATLVLLTGHTGRGTALGFAVVAVATGAVLRRSDSSLTGTLASAITLLAYWAGAYVGRGAWTVAGALTVGLAILVSSGPYLIVRLRGLTPHDARIALAFGVLATVVFYLLPAANLGPWGALNPRRLWGLIVLVSSMSFAAFVVSCTWGRARGLYLAAFIGGLVSSTATTVALANQSRGSKAGLSLAIGAGLASLATLVRVWMLAEAAGEAVVRPLLPLLAVMFAGGGLGTVYLMRGTQPAADGTNLVGNPLRWQQVLRFTVLYTLVKLGLEVALRNRGAAGAMWASAVAGGIDLDAITLTLAGIAGRTFDPRVAASAIGVAVLANAAIKLAYAILRGDRMFWRTLAAVLGVAIAAGAAMLML
jgi:uncharacterized membrane protein (DUF4010 family)